MKLGMCIVCEHIAGIYLVLKEMTKTSNNTLKQNVANTTPIVYVSEPN